MGADPTLASATTTDAVAATTQSRDEADAQGADAQSADVQAALAQAASAQGATAREAAIPDAGLPFAIGEAIGRIPVHPYRRKHGDPLYRPLRIYTVDPSAQRLEGAIGTINVPWEPLQPGPVGALFEVDNRDAGLGVAYRSADLDDPQVLLTDGYAPSPTDPRFHQQMVYAVCSNVYSAFRTALGRNPDFGFGDGVVPARLVLAPHGGNESNAWYETDGTRGSIRYGYFRADEHPTIRTLPRGYVFTCLSHDIVAHEITHALLDGLRARLGIPSGPDVVAFHEAFADLVAIFQHFSYREVVMHAIRQSRGSFERGSLLTGLAQQFGHTTGQNGPLRSAIDDDLDHPRRYRDDLEPHLLGSVLLGAVFETFTRIFRRKTERYLRIATNGSGVLPPGDLPRDLQEVLADKASSLASQFLSICIRAIDYCPPVGLTFGDYLRALVTADFDLVPDDPWDYRGALVDAFWRREIHPRSVASLSEDALLWHGPRIELAPVPELGFGDLRFHGDPGNAADASERLRQARALGRYVTQPEHLEEFGLVADGDERLEGDRVDPPCVESVRTARRVGPDGQIAFDLVAEITQLRHVRASVHGAAFAFHGGCTVILGPDAEVRYVVLKSVVGKGRLERRRAFLQGDAGSSYWSLVDGAYRPRPGLLRRMHERSRIAAGRDAAPGQIDAASTS